MDFVLAFQSSGTTEGNAFFGLIQFVTSQFQRYTLDLT